MSENIEVVILDSGAFIGGAKIDRFGPDTIYVTVPSVINEIRDKKTREMVDAFPYKIEQRQVSGAAMKAVSQFAKKTGDLASLSGPDLQIIALTYMYELEKFGTKRIRTEPPSIQKAKDKAPVPPDELISVTPFAADENIEVLDSGVGVLNDYLFLPTQYFHDKYSITIAATSKTAAAAEGAAAEAATAEAGVGTNEEGETLWCLHPNCLASTAFFADKNTLAQHTVTFHAEQEGALVEEKLTTQKSTSTTTTPTTSTNTSTNTATTSTAQSNDQEIDMENDPFWKSVSGGTGGGEIKASDPEGEWINEKNIHLITRDKETAQTDSTQSTVAVITTDYAMQNVILQMGLRLLSINGLSISQIRTSCKRCHSCDYVERDMEREFCQDCGGHTLVKVTVTVNSKGIPRYRMPWRTIHNTRGTIYSIPKMKGGRKNNDLKLREDSMSQSKLFAYKKRDFHENFIDAVEFALHKVGKKSVHDDEVFGYGKKNPNATHKQRAAHNKNKRNHRRR